MALKSGFLTKEGGSIKTWKKRWCVLKSGALHYSKSASSGDLGIIQLDTAGEIKASSARKKKKHLLEITTPARTYYMCADTQAAMDDWVKELIAERDRVQRKNVSSGPSSAPQTSSSSHDSASNGSSGSNGAGAPAPVATGSGANPHTEKVGIDDFESLCVIGKGSFGKVMQVKKKDTGKIYAMKILNKQTIIERNELEHTRSEKSILQKLCHPFLVNLNYSFQTPDKLFFIMDYVNGGELFYHLQRDKRFSEERARFYCAEIVLGLEYLHNSGVLYRDLKPENLLLTDDGHICMTDFGISKEGLVSDDDRTATFCGTPEYLAPEVLEGNGYGKAVDWWSFGTLMFEMLTGLPPFYSEDVQQMYQKIMTARLQIPKTVSDEAKDLLEKLLIRDPEQRLTEPPMIKKHPWFAGIDWEALVQKEVTPPFIPPVSGKEDTSQVDPVFTGEDHNLSVTNTTEINTADQKSFVGFTYVAPSGLDA
eukprot:TRINITY_DN610_c0_g1_i1.p1 TRINITY_DN610_c0_g1~~TRINITY_DN610_c0_g1_i1.p1  ORF type:complete len:494 (+),score=244.84 TRINITY_DN610_c0_g1_i1:44-1483(+)